MQHRIPQRRRPLRDRQIRPEPERQRGHDLGVRRRRAQPAFRVRDPGQTHLIPATLPSTSTLHALLQPEQRRPLVDRPIRETQRKFAVVGVADSNFEVSDIHDPGSGDARVPRVRLHRQSMVSVRDSEVPPVTRRAQPPLGLYGIESAG
ncbi:hypothetical protein FM112_14645 [Gulosibacter sp. 10]|nr:hypothetical protein FM112_14645 [Gulosibacter sp. 10]